LVEEGVRDTLSSEVSATSLDNQIGQLTIQPPNSSSIASEDAPAQERQTTLFVTAGNHWDEDKEEAPKSRSRKGLENQTASLDLEQPNPGLLQVLNTYILAETQEGLIIIDQHSAHERILFEKIMTALDSESKFAQRLLFPLTIRLTRAEFQETMTLSGILKNLGFEIEGFGGDTVIVQAVPNPHPYFDAERCFREMLRELIEGSDLTRSAKNQHEKIAMVFSCKSAIKAGQELTEVEMQELFDQLFATELPYHDVHGRPTIIRLGKGELKSKFGR